MKPLIKWTGGKSGELNIILPIIRGAVIDPTFNKGRFIEPFLGGGATFFALEPKKSVINDNNPELMQMYTILKNTGDREALKKELNKIIKERKIISEQSKIHVNNLYKKHYLPYHQGRNDKGKLVSKIESLIDQAGINLNKDIKEEIKKQLVNKILRVSGYEKKDKDGWDTSSVKDQLVTAWHSAYYIYQREKDDNNLSNIESTARFIYIREFCYAGMFRYNSQGKFNVPYGGLSYNNKDFKKKVNNILGEEVHNLLNGSKIYCEDFTQLIKKVKPNNNDFVFLDPPYDFTFNNYGSSFGKDEHKKLAMEYAKLKCPALMIISDTSYVKGLYNDVKKINKDIKIDSYEKKYMNNIKNRFNRNVNHLAITNWK